MRFVQKFTHCFLEKFTQMAKIFTRPPVATNLNSGGGGGDYYEVWWWTIYRSRDCQSLFCGQSSETANKNVKKNLMMTNLQIVHPPGSEGGTDSSGVRSQNFPSSLWEFSFNLNYLVCFIWNSSAFLLFFFVIFKFLLMPQNTLTIFAKNLVTTRCHILCSMRLHCVSKTLTPCRMH